MQRMTANSDHLPLMNKVEVFEHALEHTEGDDLAKIMLLKAPSSEVSWMEDQLEVHTADELFFPPGLV